MPERVILYGAEVRFRSGPWHLRQLKFWVRRQRATRRDLLRCGRGDLSTLDYRNYDSPRSVNLGDVAIGQAVAGCLKASLPARGLRRLNWGELPELERGPLAVRRPGIVIGGSGYLIFDAQGRLATRVHRDVETFERLDATLVLLGIGVNRPETQGHLDEDIPIRSRDAVVLERLLARTRSLSVRDTQTQRLLSRYTDQPVALTGDPALHLPSFYPASPERAKIPAETSRPLVGLNLSFHGPIPNDLLRSNFDSYVRVLQAIQARTGCRFRYIQHFEAERIVPALLASRGLRTEVVRGYPARLLAAYRDLDLHLGGMLHSCILANAVDIPCLGLAYDIKHHGYFELMGQPRNCLSANRFDPEQLLDRALELLANPDSVRATVRAQRLRLEADTREFAAASLSLLQDKTSAVLVPRPGSAGQVAIQTT